MRILWSSNAPWSPSGYGVQAQYIIPRLYGMGHQVAIMAWDGLHHGKIDLAGVPVYPGGHEPFGRDFIGETADHFGAEIVVSLQDIWPLPMDYRERVGRPWMPWFPIDHQPCSPFVVDRALTAEYPATYSRHGVETMAAAGVEAHYLPLGVDCEVFRPMDRAGARALFGFPEDRYLVVMVAANVGWPSRKAFPEQFEAFARFADANRELDPLLYVHADPEKGPGQGLDLKHLAAALGIEDRVWFPDRYQYMIAYTNRALAPLYSAADVLLAASMAEGFGLPIAEAQACGCPAIVNGWASMPELCKNGIVVEPCQRYWTRIESWYSIPDVGGVAAALDEVAGWDEYTRAAYAERGRHFIRSEFDWDVVMQRHWAPLLETIGADLAPGDGGGRGKNGQRKAKNGGR